MKIAYVSSGEFGCPPPVNRIQAALWICGQMIEGMSRRGHQTIYIGVDGSTVAASEKISMGPAFFDLYPYDTWVNFSVADKDRTLNSYQTALQLFLINYLQDHPVDLVHFHTSPPVFALPFAAQIKQPKVFTFHDPLYASYGPLFQAFHRDDNHFVTISRAQRSELPELNYAATVYNGIPVTDYPIGQGGDYLLFLGRIMRQKGIKDAALAARSSGEKLLIAGKMVTSSREYLEREVIPFIDGKQIQQVGVVAHPEKVKLIGDAKALLFPIEWPEPFGLVMIEAMACGTPVIAYNRGSVSEIVRDGITGFVVEDEDEAGNPKSEIRNPKQTQNPKFKIQKKGVAGLVEAIGRIGEIDRAACRRHVEENFTVEKMVAGYEAVYRKVLGR